MIADANNNDPLGGSGGELANARDVRLVGRLLRRQEWDIPDEIYARLPELLATIAHDETKSDRARSSAVKSLLVMHEQNHKHAAGALTTFHRIEGKRPPELPMRSTSDSAEVAYIEQASEDELRETCKVLVELGIVQRMADEIKEEHKGR